MLYHLLKSTLHSKANACNIGTFIRFYMQSTLHSKANACNIGTIIRFYIQMRVQKNNKAFAYRFYRPFTQQCLAKIFLILYPPFENYTTHTAIINTLSKRTLKFISKRTFDKLVLCTALFFHNTQIWPKRLSCLMAIFFWIVFKQKPLIFFLAYN